ncbi:hypothetical protein J8641_13175 [Neisseria elongata subsp. nitroreducens]|uniref:Uncharacterized protein n=1 Tax=Neisseria elongata subsp. nitroreducens TaxID=90367 RepID=A0A9X0ZWC6_NEIEL|nr:hypothetical protein [Neisseria elongata]MBS9341723.1 hypothetical protein [Neisseria elongata subsp. nitroreducens]
MTKQQIILARIFFGYGCLDAVDQDTSSKQEVAIVLIYSCQYIFTPLQNFNTQPPEGGWPKLSRGSVKVGDFNTQPPEGGWQNILDLHRTVAVSTHSRLKAAGPSPLCWRQR